MTVGNKCVRTYAVERSTPRSSVIYHRTPTLDELDNYS